ncbi:unnamed protein product [Agarophyton chilense]
MYAHLTGGKKNLEEIARDAGVNVTRVSSSTFDLEKLVSHVADDNCVDKRGVSRGKKAKDQEPTEEPDCKEQQG